MPGELDVGLIPAPGLRQGERTGIDVDRQQVVEPAGQLRGEHADRAAHLQAGTVAGSRQAG